MLAFRIADQRHPIFDPTGAYLHGGRWNSAGKRVIYAAQTYAGALLEVLVHANLGVVPRTQAVVEIAIPEEGVPVETLRGADLEGWAADDMTVSRRFGDRWLDERRTAVLLVPSVALQGRERNVLINPDHPDFAHIGVSAAETVVWDPRLFSRVRQG
jgi:RES domain-containing protein